MTGEKTDQEWAKCVGEDIYIPGKLYFEMSWITRFVSWLIRLLERGLCQK